MKLRHKHYIALIVTGAAHFASIAAYGEDAPTKQAATRSQANVQSDVQFLEYLGTLEGDNENWTDVAKGDLINSVSDASDAATKPLPIKNTAQNSEAASRKAESK